MGGFRPARPKPGNVGPQPPGQETGVCILRLQYEMVGFRPTGKSRKCRPRAARPGKRHLCTEASKGKGLFQASWPKRGNVDKEQKGQDRKEAFVYGGFNRKWAVSEQPAKAGNVEPEPPGQERGVCVLRLPKEMGGFRQAGENKEMWTQRRQARKKAFAH